MEDLHDNSSENKRISEFTEVTAITKVTAITIDKILPDTGTPKK
jgi:hypothetical protein